MLGTYFEQSFFVGNRKKLRQSFGGTAPIVITSNGIMQRNGDNTYNFRQDSNFWYLTGIDDPDITLVIDKSKEYLIVPIRDKVRAMFDGQLDYSVMAERSGVKTIYDEKAGWNYLAKRLKKVKHVATLEALPIYEERHGFYANPARARLLEKMRSLNPPIEVLDLRLTLARLRAIKQPSELTAIKRAIHLTSSALKKVKRNLNNYKSELEVEAVLVDYFKRLGVGTAYQTIAASGVNASQVHYFNNSQILNNLLLIDVGAEVENYAADISRTYAVDSPSKRLSDVHQAVLDVHAYALSLLGPAINMKNYEELVRQYMGEKLRELGLIKSISKESIMDYYPHSVSHFLGLDVHDAGDYNQPLAPGMVLTVEPGIYIAKEGIGVRIEDDILITNKGIKNLSGTLPTSLV